MKNLCAGVSGQGVSGDEVDTKGILVDTKGILEGSLCSTAREG